MPHHDHSPLMEVAVRAILAARDAHGPLTAGDPLLEATETLRVQLESGQAAAMFWRGHHMNAFRAAVAGLATGHTHNTPGFLAAAKGLEDAIEGKVAAAVVATAPVDPVTPPVVAAVVSPVALAPVATPAS